MALRSLRLEGDALLRKKSKPVKAITPNILALIDDLIETMRKHNGAGIAAPQVGVLRRVAVIETEENIIELINPEILETGGSNIENEGCLSIPGIVGTVDRPDYVRFKTLDRSGNEIALECRGRTAKAICHEVDHLDGVLFVDKVIEYVHESEMEE